MSKQTTAPQPTRGYPNPQTGGSVTGAPKLTSYINNVGGSEDQKQPEYINGQGGRPWGER